MGNRRKEPDLRVGVTGHRILAERERLETAIDEALTRFQETFPGRPLSVLSALAEGTDRIVARRALARPGTHLVAILPLPKAEYSDDFGPPESRQEFLTLLDQACEVINLPYPGTRNAAYEAGGEYVLDHCDVLLTIWDGQGAQGQGGTGAIVHRARQRHLPLAWVHAGNRKPGTLEPTTLGKDQGKVTFENF